MHDARDAADNRLLEADDRARLLATYFPVIRDRCRLRLPAADADEVAQRVALRLLDELDRGKRYPVPYRVVVHKVTEWTIKEFFGERGESALPEDWDTAGPDAYESFESGYDFQNWIADLPEREQEALRWRYQDGLEVKEIAERLGISPNAGDQLLWRAREKLKRG